MTKLSASWYAAMPPVVVSDEVVSDEVDELDELDVGSQVPGPDPDPVGPVLSPEVPVELEPPVDADSVSWEEDDDESSPHPNASIEEYAIRRRFVWEIRDIVAR